TCVASVFLLSAGALAEAAPGATAVATINASPQSTAEAGFITRLLNKPVPGGVAVVQLGHQPQAPQDGYHERRVMVLDDKGRWIAVVGVPLSANIGQHHVAVESAQGKQRATFTVEPRTYTEQHIPLKNQRQVMPTPDDLKRIRRE